MNAGDTGWRARLENLHSAQLALLDELQDLTSRPVPEQAPLACVRWKLSNASRERRAIWDQRINPDLLQKASPKLAAMLERLGESEGALRSSSATHVRRWPIEKILWDWKGYCAASQAMRESLRKKISAEKDALYLAERLYLN